MLMKFVLTQPLDEAAMNVLKEAGADVYIANSPDLPSYIDKIQEADALVIRVGQCTAEVIDACPNLKVIGITGVGYDRVDVAHASGKKLPVVFTPGANSLSVAEHTVALMFAAAKNLSESDEEFAKRELEDPRWPGKAIELSGKKVGIIVSVRSVPRLQRSARESAWRPQGSAIQRTAQRWKLPDVNTMKIWMIS